MFFTRPSNTFSMAFRQVSGGLPTKFLRYWQNGIVEEILGILIRMRIIIRIYDSEH